MTLRMAWPLWANLLVLLPLIVIVIIGWRSARRTGDVPQRTWSRRAGMVVCLAAATLTPAVPADVDRVESTAEVFFVVDLTGSMAAEDYNGDQQRLDGVRQDVLDIVESMPGARFSIIGFSSSAARQLPLTSDTNAIRTWVETMQREASLYSAGSTMDRPHDMLLDTLTRAQENNPEHVRVVYFMSDGEDTNGDDSAPSEPGRYTDIDPLVDAGAVLGYGTEEGGRMREYSGFGEEWESYIQAPGGGEAISQIDQDNLQRIADEMGVDYLHRTAPGGLEAVTDVDAEQIAAEDGRQPAHLYRDVVWPFMLVLAALLVWEMIELAPTMRAVGAERVRNRHTRAPKNRAKRAGRQRNNRAQPPANSGGMPPGAAANVRTDRQRGGPPVGAAPRLTADPSQQQRRRQ